jgi:hypothetical protein
MFYDRLLDFQHVITRFLRRGLCEQLCLASTRSITTESRRAAGIFGVDRLFPKTCMQRARMMKSETPVAIALGYGEDLELGYCDVLLS